MLRALSPVSFLAALLLWRPGFCLDFEAEVPGFPDIAVPHIILIPRSNVTIAYMNIQVVSENRTAAVEISLVPAKMALNNEVSVLDLKRASIASASFAGGWQGMATRQVTADISTAALVIRRTKSDGRIIVMGQILVSDDVAGGYLEADQRVAWDVCYRMFVCVLGLLAAWIALHTHLHCSLSQAHGEEVLVTLAAFAAALCCCCGSLRWQDTSGRPCAVLDLAALLLMTFSTVQLTDVLWDAVAGHKASGTFALFRHALALVALCWWHSRRVMLGIPAPLAPLAVMRFAVVAAAPAVVAVAAFAGLFLDSQSAEAPRHAKRAWAIMALASPCFLLFLAFSPIDSALAVQFGDQSDLAHHMWLTYTVPCCLLLLALLGTMVLLRPAEWRCPAPAKLPPVGGRGA